MREFAFIPWGELENKTIFITGATGLIGRSIVSMLLNKGININVVALVRNEKTAKNYFLEYGDSVKIIQGTVEELPKYIGDIDYIVHAASETSSKAFVKKPVETIGTALVGTLNVLNLAKEKNVKGIIYLSSMEVYGYPEKGHKVTEEEIGAFYPTELRSSYPLSKVECENLCVAYAREYGVPAKIIRLTQTFGSGVQYNDSRVFAYFARCAMENSDIVLKTKGETERSYLFTEDAASAILTVLLKGINGEIYNAADEKTYCSISEMAELVAQMGNVSVKYELQDASQNGFLNTLYMDLSTEKLKKLGWIPMGEGLQYMFDAMMKDMSKSHDPQPR